MADALIHAVWAPARKLPHRQTMQRFKNEISDLKKNHPKIGSILKVCNFFVPFFPITGHIRANI